MEKELRVSRPEPEGWDWNKMTAEEYAYLWADSRSPRWIFTHECEKEILQAREKGSSIEAEYPDFFKESKVQRLILVIKTCGVNSANNAWHKEHGDEVLSDAKIDALHRYIWQGGKMPKMLVSQKTPAAAGKVTSGGKKTSSPKDDVLSKLDSMENKIDHLSRTLESVSCFRSSMPEGKDDGFADIKINSPFDAAGLMRDQLAGLDHEEFWAVMTGCDNKPIRKRMICVGGATCTTFDIKGTVREALLCGALGIIVYHNHPSGYPKPSITDIKQTKMLHKALELFEIKLLDHIILADKSFYSFSAEEELKYANDENDKR